MAHLSALARCRNWSVLAAVAVASLGPTQSETNQGNGKRDRVLSTSGQIESLFKAFKEERHLPSIVWGVVLDGELLYSGELGQANLDEKLPANAQTYFRIASMTKSFTALAILQLRDAGKLRLDDLASKYVAELGDLAYLSDDAPQITIRHLLTHGGGFPEDNPWGDRQLAAPDEELRDMLSGGVSFSNAPGIHYEYSNLGYAILGQIVQSVSGQEYRDYMRKQVFDPLGMSNTEWDYREVPKERLALGYGWIDESHQRIPIEPHGAYGAMGGLITTIEDFTKYAALHLNAWPARSGEDLAPLKRSSLREMHQPGQISSVIPNQIFPGGQTKAVTHGYAFGLRWSRDEDGIITVGHTGGLPGYGSNWMMLPQYGLAVMSFDNLTYAATRALNFEVLHTIVDLAGLKPRAIQASAILKQRKAELLKVLPDWKNAEASGIFAENFFPDRRLNDRKAETAELFEQVGSIKKVGPLSPLNQLRGSFLLHGEKGDLEVFFTLTPEKNPLIQRLDMKIVEGPEKP